MKSYSGANILVADGITGEVNYSSTVTVDRPFIRTSQLFSHQPRSKYI